MFVMILLYFILFYFIFFFLGPFCGIFANGSSLARGQIKATAAGQIKATATGIAHHRHSNVGYKPRLPPTPQLMALPDP